MHEKMSGIIDSGIDAPLDQVRKALIEYGIAEETLDKETHNAIAASSTISYLHLGRPETILINTHENLREIMAQASARMSAAT
jgi:hypothetical protein